MESMRKASLFLVTVLFVLSLVQTPATASKKSYIVYLGGHSHAKDASFDDYKRATDSHYLFLESFVGGQEKAKDAIIYSYTYDINGFAANLDEEEAKEIEKHPDVISVFPNKLNKLHTTRSWTLLGLAKDGRIPAGSIWKKARFGEDTIIANLDTGVWPESKSFNDEGMGPIPSRWKGFCQNNTKIGVPCNRKLIGARFFNTGVGDSSDPPSPPGPSFDSARDIVGHGTHTLSTAAGRFVPGANIFGYANGTAAGGSPNARVATYRVCAEDGCYAADILAGFDAAIHDGVDVISVSLGGEPAVYFNDPVAIGAFHAVKNGITVVCSGGNSGPTVGTVSNGAPWILTVAASTLDREFTSYLALGNKNLKHIQGQSLSSKRLPAKFYPLLDAKDAKFKNATVDEGQMCYMDTLDPKKVKGKIVVCLRGDVSREEKGEAILKAGGVGMVIVNTQEYGETIFADPHLLPATHIPYSGAVALSSYMNSTKSPVGYISSPSTRFGVKPTPFMADFSSRGPSLVSPSILKPDVTAPGVSVLAAFTEATSPTSLDYDHRRVEYNLLSGTSMSCPHVSGIVGLLKTLHPDWSPSAIRSAIMTTARTRDNTGKGIRDDTLTKATPLDYGSGHVWPNRAMDPGLIYDLAMHDHLNFLCAIGYNSTQMATLIKNYSCPSKPIKPEDLNYPSITVTALKKSFTVTRTLKNVGSPGTYKAKVEAPIGVSVSVKPKILKFEKVGEKKTFNVHFKSTGSVKNVVRYGKLTWSDGKHYVRSPIVVDILSVGFDS